MDFSPLRFSPEQSDDNFGLEQSDIDDFSLGSEGFDFPCENTAPQDYKLQAGKHFPLNMKRGPLQDVTNTSHWLPVQGIFEQDNPPDCSRAHDAPRRKTKNSKKRAAEEDLADLIDTRRKNSSAPTGTLSKSSFSSPVKFSGLDLEKPSKLTAREFGEKIDWAIKFPFSWKDGDIVDWSNVRLSVTVTLSEKYKLPDSQHDFIALFKVLRDGKSATQGEQFHERKVTMFGQGKFESFAKESKKDPLEIAFPVELAAIPRPHSNKLTLGVALGIKSECLKKNVKVMAWQHERSFVKKFSYRLYLATDPRKDLWTVQPEHNKFNKWNEEKPDSPKSFVSISAERLKDLELHYHPNCKCDDSEHES